MSKIPKPTQAALDEAYSKIILDNFANMADSELEDHLRKHHDTLAERQPGIHEFIKRICSGHTAETKALINVPQFALYVMILMDSLYVQKEIDEVTDIFNQDEE